MKRVLQSRAELQSLLVFRLNGFMHSQILCIFETSDQVIDGKCPVMLAREDFYGLKEMASFTSLDKLAKIDNTCQIIKYNCWAVYDHLFSIV